jgi:thioredoxin:protein disulfide reductase
MPKFSTLHRGLTLALLATLALSTGAALAEDAFGVGDPFAPPELKVSVEPLADPLVAGETVAFAVTYHIPEGTHLTEYFRTVLIKSEPAAEFGEALWPEGIAEGEEHIWRGEVVVRSRVTLPAAGNFKLNIEAEYQICQEGEVEMCFPPTAAILTAEYSIEPSGTEFTEKAESGEREAVSGQPAPEGKGLAGKLEAALNRGSWVAFLLVFLGGVLTSFTPCVYPMIPITISFIGGSAKGNPLKGFVLAVWFVLGIAIMYSSLGLLAAATGSAFGQATQTPIFAGIVAVIIGAMGLSMAGLFDIQIPSGLTSKMGGAKTGFLGPILMGMAMGLIAAPCVGPVLIVLLTWVAQTGSLFMGFWLLFTFAAGLGMLFLALGTFSGLLTALPGAGGWMDQVKHFFALVLFALALYFLKPYLPGWMLTLALGLAIVFSLSAWGALKPLSEDAGAKEGMGKGLSRLLWILGVVLAILGGIKGFAPGLLPSGGGTATMETAEAHQEPLWIWDETEGFAQAAAEGKPIMMDFWAEWCVACNELDHFTYNQPEILDLAEDFVSIKMDMTKNSAENKTKLNKYEVFGMPTVIFFDSSGVELERFSGFISADNMAPYMQRALATK